MTTKPSIALADVLDKRADGNLLREMIAYVAQQLMQFDVDNRCAAGRLLKGVG